MNQMRLNMNQMRKFGLILSLFIFAISITIFHSCADDDPMLSNPIELQTPYGNWKFQGYGSDESKNIEKVTSSNSNAFRLTLNKDNTFVGTSSVNEISGKFTAVPKNGLIKFLSEDDSFNIGNQTETKDGDLYLKRLMEVENFRTFPLQKELRLYYSMTEREKKYLSYKMIEQSKR